MTKKYFFYTAIILFPFFNLNKAAAQGKERHRSVTINQTVVDGKVVSSDTIITYNDTITRTINSKEVSMELPYQKGSTVHISNEYRQVNIRQSKDNKVRLNTTTFYYGEPTFTNEQWLEKLNIKMEKADFGIGITSGSINQTGNSSSYRIYNSSESFGYGKSPIPPTPPTPPVKQNGTLQEITLNGKSSKTAAVDLIDGQGSIIINNQAIGKKSLTFRGTSINSTAVFDEKGNISYNSSSLRRVLTIYVPADAKLDIDSKYGNVSIDFDLRDVSVNIGNASLDMANTTNLTASVTYGNISAGNINTARISVTNGKLFIKKITELDLATKYAKVEADDIGTLKMQSISDDYDLDKVKNLSGKKNYGTLRVDKLTGSFELQGSSADLKIKNIEPSVTNITLDNKYADVQLPVTDLKNYEVTFTGNYSSVFAPFERKDTTLATTTTDNQSNPNQITIVTTGQGSSTTTYGSALAPLATVKGFNNSRRNGQSFTATVGDTKGTHTIFKLVCNSCNVDFK